MCEVLPIVSVVIFHGNDVLSLMLIKGTQQIEENLHSGLEPFNAVWVAWRGAVATGGCARSGVVKTDDYIYVFEFKLDGSADEALAQIDNRGYLIPYTADDRKLVKIGVNFDPKERNIGEWCKGKGF